MKINMPNPVKSLGYQVPQFEEPQTCWKAKQFYRIQFSEDLQLIRRSAVDREDLKPYWKSEKKGHISVSDHQTYY